MVADHRLERPGIERGVLVVGGEVLRRVVGLRVGEAQALLPVQSAACSAWRQSTPAVSRGTGGQICERRGSASSSRGSYTGE
jgi:hypothetical protein